MLTRKKNPITPAAHQVSGGLMTAGIKPGELPSTTLPNIDASTAQTTTQAASQATPTPTLPESAESE